MTVELERTVAAHLERRELGALVDLALGDATPYLGAVGDGVGSHAYPAVARRAGDVLPLLDDTDPEVRGGAAYLLAFLAETAPSSLAAVRARLPGEAHPGVRASLILADGYLAAIVEGEHAGPEPSLGASAVEDFAAIVAHAVRGSPLFGVEVSGELVAAFEQALAWGPIAGLGWPASLVARANRWRVRRRWRVGDFTGDALVFDARPDAEGEPDEGEADEGEPDEGGEEDAPDDSEASTDPYTHERPPSTAGSIPVDLAGLDDVPWRELENAYGRADGVPDQIRALASLDPEERAWAVGALFAGINHQGSIYSASGPSAPFLIRLVADGRVAGRDRILHLLLGLAMNDPLWRVIDGAHGDRSDCYEAVRAGVDVFVPLLTDADVSVRTATSFLLGFLDPGRDLRPAVRAALAAELDPRARASHILCLGLHGRYLRDRADEDRLVELLGDDSRLVRAAAALALVSARRGDAPREAFVMLDRLRRERFTVAGPFGWHEGNIAEYAGVILRAHQTVAQVLDDLPRLPLDVARLAAVNLVERRFPREHAPWIYEELDAEQRRILHHFADGEDSGPWRHESGLPSTGRGLRRFLGVDPPGPLDGEIAVAGRRWPWWRAFEAVLTDELSGLDEGALARAAGGCDVIALAEDVLGRAYLLLHRRRHDWQDLDAELAYSSRALLLTAALAATAGERALAWAREVAAGQLARQGPDRQRAIFEGRLADPMACCVAGVILARADELGDQPDELFRLDEPPGSTYPGPLREMLAAVPLERRAALLERIKLHSITHQVDPRGGTYHFRRELGWHLIDLLPTARGAERVLESLRTYERHHGSPRATPMERPTGSVRAPYPLPRPDHPFPRERALAVLAAQGVAAAPVLEAALAAGDVLDRDLVVEALARIRAGRGA